VTKMRTGVVFVHLRSVGVAACVSVLRSSGDKIGRSVNELVFREVGLIVL
jgi:hypothetical protein